MLVLSSSLIFSFFLSDLALRELAQSQYFQSKVSQALEANKISSKGAISIKLNKFSSVDINIEKASFSSSNNIVGHDINLKVDLMKYWLGLNFIDEISIMKMIYNLPNKSKVNPLDMNSVDLKLFAQSMHSPLNKINSKSIYIEKGILALQSQIFNFEKVYIFNDKTSLVTKAVFTVKPNSSNMNNEAIVKLSLDDDNIIKFSITLKVHDYNDFFYLEEIPKVARLLIDRLIKHSGFTDKETKEITAVGTYDLSSNNLSLELANITNRFKFNSSVNIQELFVNNNFVFSKTELVIGDLSLSASKMYFDIVNRKFEISVTKFLMPHYDNSVFANKFKVFGIFLLEDKVLGKVNIIGETPSKLNVSLEINESSQRQDNETASYDFFVKVNALQKTSLNKIGFLSNFFSNLGTKQVSVSNADAQISLNFGDKYVKLNSVKAKINSLVYFENNKPSVELEKIYIKGNLVQGYTTITSVNNMETSKNIYKDIKVELSSTNKVNHQKEITLSFKSKISDLMSLVAKTKNNFTWMNSLVRSQQDQEVSIIYSKEIALDNIRSLFNLEENIFELNVKNLSIPLTAKNFVNLELLNFKGVGNTIFFEGYMAPIDKKISGSINNWLFNTLSDSTAGNLNIFLDNFNSKDLFPNFSTFDVKGPLKLTFFPPGTDDKIFIKSNVDLTDADVSIPALALKKLKGKYGLLEIDFSKDNRSLFNYYQKDVLVSGSASHGSIFEIEKVNYLNIKTPDLRIEKAKFQKFAEYDQFKASKGTISLEFLMRVRLKKKNVPLNLIFNDIDVTFKKNKFLDSLKGEIRSFNGLRGYAKAKLSQNSNLEITISPHKKNGINMVVSGNDAGELLRRGKFYENGYGGLFKASIHYNSRFKMSGTLEIEEFRIRNAPVLAQIISSASIIGLLDNLNGNGLLFTKIEGSFDYKTGELTLKDGVAVGPSLGLTMDGFEQYGKKQNTVNVSGLVSPVYIINGVVKAIPLIGKVLGGEKGEGVFGVSYKVQGNSSSPIVLVNPLSILTPGIFRNIFNMQENDKR